jgi:exopolysaccharide biosynthesis polyprenyl glycosylphosphotransferase
MSARSHIRALALWVATMDLICLCAGSVIGLLIRMPKWERSQVVFDNMPGWVLLFAAVLLANYLAGSYRLQQTFSRFNLVVTWVFTLAFALIFLAFTSSAWLRFFWLKGVLLASLGVYSILSLSFRLLIYQHVFRSQFFLCRTVIIGSDERAQQLRELVERDYVIPIHRVVAFLRLNAAGPGGGSTLDGVTVVDVTEETLEHTVRSLGANLIILATAARKQVAECYPALKRLRFDRAEVQTMLQAYEVYEGRMPLKLLNEEHLMEASMTSRFPVFRQFKVIFDRTLASLASILVLPLVAVIVVAMKLTEPFGPIFYTQSRVGRFGRPFRILKFRTMKVDAEKETGAVWCTEDDPRITRVGRILRRYRLDELPQLLNILKGEMSIVGPRPERPELTEALARRIPFYEERENVVPGLTGWAQIRYPYGNTIEDAARKLEYDLYYIQYLSFSLDLQIILSTFRIVLFGKEHQH